MADRKTGGNTADVRVRITEDINEQLLSLANATRINDALPIAWRAVEMYRALHYESNQCDNFYLEDGNGQLYRLRVLTANVVIGHADVRVRFTPNLVNAILDLAGAKKLQEALPYLAQALHVYKSVTRAEMEGSKLCTIDEHGEKCYLKFI